MRSWRLFVFRLLVGVFVLIAVEAWLQPLVPCVAFTCHLLLRSVVVGAMLSLRRDCRAICTEKKPQNCRLADYLNGGLIATEEVVRQTKRLRPRSNIADTFGFCETIMRTLRLGAIAMESPDCLER